MIANAILVFPTPLWVPAMMRLRILTEGAYLFAEINLSSSALKER